MHTNTLLRAETRTLSIAAAPDEVVGYLRDPQKLPEWAPNVASEVEVDGTDIVVNPGSDSLRMRLRISPDAGTVDLVSAADPRMGAFLRALPNGHGTELLFTLLFPAETPQDAIDGQMTEVEAELARVRRATATG